MTERDLQPISPGRAKEMYLEARKHEVSESTLSGYHYRLKHFVRWCAEEASIDNMNELTGRQLQEFKTWRRDENGLKPITLRGQLDALRIFLRWCESIDAVEKGLHDKIVMPVLKKDDEQSEEILRSEDAEKVLAYLRRFEYTSRWHVILELLWHTGIRLGALYSLDVDDYDSEKERLEIRNCPDRGTPLKNGNEGERIVALTPDVCRIIEDWIEHQRPEATDEHGREPLLTSERGRLGKSCIRDAVYKATRPCYYGEECPHDRDTDDCEAAQYGGYSKCPSNVSPHAIRRGSITRHLSEDVPEKVVSDRMNVGQDVLDKHYDKRTEEQKVEQRRGYLEEL
jgi:site-specific recombinase XerD